ncbi:DNA-directed RNA polymerase subunit N [archaeon]|nr:DNA-directed RNA polymerase subunit N [archaeon]
MIIPIRCFTCGTLIGDKWEEFKRRVEQGEDPHKVLEELGVTRYCCKRMLISHVEIIDRIVELFNAIEQRQKEEAEERGVFR